MSHEISLTDFQKRTPSLGEAEAAELVGPDGLDVDAGPGADTVHISLSHDALNRNQYDVSINDRVPRHLTLDQLKALNLAQCTGSPPNAPAKTSSTLVSFDVGNMSKEEIAKLKQLPVSAKELAKLKHADVSEAALKQLKHGDISDAKLQALKGGSKSEQAKAVAIEGDRQKAAEIEAHRQKAHDMEVKVRLGQTIEHAKAAYGDLLPPNKPAVTIRVFASAGNGDQPVMVVTGPEFKPGADVHVHTYYHGDNATVADPLGSKSGINARIRATLLDGAKPADDKQAMFVLPEAANGVRPDVDSPTNDLHYPVNWDNVSDQVKTVSDALEAAHVNASAVSERVVSAHSGGGMAINNAINADPKGGTHLQADRIELYDCLYHFRYQVPEKTVNGEKVPAHFVYPKEWETDTRLENWSKTPNGQAVKGVVFYSAGSDDKPGTRSARVASSFPPDASGHARYRKVDMENEPKMFDDTGKLKPSLDPVAHGVDGKEIPQTVKREGESKYTVAHDYIPQAHYRTVGQHLGERPKP